jgi:hypothetical protein
MGDKALAIRYSCQRSFGVIHTKVGRTNCRMEIAEFKTENSTWHGACVKNKQVTKSLMDD